MAVAKKYMTENPITLGSGDTLQQAVELFADKGIGSAVVITPLGEVLGNMTELSLVKALVMSQVTKDANQKINYYKEILEKIHFVDEDGHVSDVLKSLIQSTSHRVLVKDSKGKMTGIITPKDLIRKLSGQFDRKDKKAILEEMEDMQNQMDEMKEKMVDLESYMDVYDTVFQSGVYMLHSSDKDGVIVFANEKLHTTLGYDNGDLLGKSIYEIYPKSVHSQVKAGLERIRLEGKHSQVYSSMVKKGGAIIRIDVASASIKDKNGDFNGTFTISREIESDHLLRSLHGIIEEGSSYGEIKD